MLSKNYFSIFIVLFLIVSTVFFNGQMNFASAISWPGSYNTVCTDTIDDAQKGPTGEVIIASDQLDIIKFYTVNSSGNNKDKKGVYYPPGFYVKMIMDDIRYINKGNRFEVHWKPTNDVNLSYKVTLYTVYTSKPGNPKIFIGTYTITFWKSINQTNNWTKLVEYANEKSEDWNSTSASLGYRIKSSNDGYVEMRINESLFDSPIPATYNVFTKTTFGSPYVDADRYPANSDIILYTREPNAFTSEWPGSTVYPPAGGYVDARYDVIKIPAEQQEILESYFTDTYHNIFARVQLKTVSSTPAIGLNTEAYLNAPGAKYANIWYMFETEYTGFNKWDLWLKRSVDNGSSWTTLESYSKVSLTNGQYDSGTLGLKITTGTPGYIEWYTKKTYIEEPAASFNLYYKTVYGSEGEDVDRAPNSGAASGGLTRFINQLTIDPPNWAPETVEQGKVDVPMTILTMATNTGTVEWTGLRIDKPISATMQKIDVERIKIWKDVNGNQTLETNEDMVVAESENNPFSDAGRADISLSPTQILTTANSYYFIYYDIDWFAGLDRTVGMYIKDKSYFTVSPPDNINYENFPFEAGNSKIIPFAYLSFNISGVDANINTEGATTTVSTGGSGWIDFGSLFPNFINVAAQELKAVTNTETGYQVRIQEDRNLTNLKTNETIPDIPGTNASPATWPSGGGFGYHTSDDSLGSGTINRFLADDTYAAIISAPEEVAYHSSATNGQTTVMVYKLQVDTLQSTGQYNNIVSYTCTTTY